MRDNAIKPKRKILMKILLASLAVTIAVSLEAAVPSHSTLISHRGESLDAPENTLPAYKTAVERGFGFECDVYLSKDGRVFTFHDTNLRRTTNGANTNACADVTWDEVSRLDVGSWGKWKDSKFAGTRPALLEEVLELAREGRFIYVEVKPGPEIVPYIKDIFAKQTKASPENTLFIAFGEETCAALKSAMPEYKVYWLTGGCRGRGKDAVPIKANAIISTLKRIEADGVDCRYHPDFTTPEFIAAIKKAGFEFHAWTVDDLSETIEVFRRGADSVTTNCAKKQLDAWNTAELMIRAQ